MKHFQYYNRQVGNAIFQPINYWTVGSKRRQVFCYGAIPRPTRDFCPTRDGLFYRPETQGRYLGEPVPMAVSRGSSDRPETISISWITSVGIAPLFVSVSSIYPRPLEILQFLKKIFCSVITFFSLRLIQK